MNINLKDEEKILSSSFLDEMKRIREERGISIEEIAEKTNIKTSHIRAIEEGDLARLPGGPYNRAFIRSISEYLGIDTKPYERKAEPNEFIKERRVKLELGRPNAGMPSKVTVIGCLLAIFIFYSVFYGPRVSKHERIEREIATIQEDQIKQVEAKIEIAKTEEEKALLQDDLRIKQQEDITLAKNISLLSPIKKETAEYINKELVITFVALEKVRIAVKDTYGKIILNKEMEKSEAVMLNGSEQYYMATSNINLLEIYLDGVQIKDIAKIEKQGNTFILKTEGLVDIAVNQPISGAIVTTKTNSLSPATVSIQAETNADNQKDNPQGKDR